jgi:hypothetical protein
MIRDKNGQAIKVIDMANQKVPVQYIVKETDIKVIFNDYYLAVYKDDKLKYDAILKDDRWYRESTFMAIIKTLVKRVKGAEQLKDVGLETFSGKLETCFQNLECLNMNEVLYRFIRKEGLSKGKIWKRSFSLVGCDSIIKALIDAKTAVLLLSVHINSKINPRDNKQVICREEINIEEIWSN